MLEYPIKKYTIKIPQSKKRQVLKISHGGGFDGHWTTNYVEVQESWGGTYLLESRYPHAWEVQGWMDAHHFTVELLEYSSEKIVLEKCV